MNVAPAPHAPGVDVCPLLPYRFARDHAVALVWSEDGTGSILMRPDTDPAVVVEARRIAGRRVRCERVAPAALERALSDIYARAGVEAADSIASGPGIVALAQNADLLDIPGDTPVIALINGVIGQAVRASASDVHLEPMADQLRVRFRIDGAMHQIANLPARLAPTLVSRVKIMGGMDIADKRVPQDGRVSLSLGGRALDLRISTLPARHGERVVMRILEQAGARLDIDRLGMPDIVRDRYTGVLAAPHGIVLVTGPTGSGKTTTLYAGLSRLHDESRNILTVEDPIEYGLDGVGQTQIRPQAGLTFASGLRAILRQDPDVIMVGEIRDHETARIAIQAGLTGHLVLSTVHTNSAAAAVTRLMDMGVEPFLLASTLRAVISQRLSRRLCPLCREGYHTAMTEAKRLGDARLAGTQIYRANGCAACGGRGYRGRVGIYEMMTLTPPIAEMIHGRAREADIHAAGIADGAALADHGIARVLAGDISISEMARIVPAGPDR